MVVRLLRLVTLTLFALTLALSFCHLMEMPARMKWDSALWVGATVEGNVFRMFGSVGALLEIGSILAALALTVVLWRRGAGRAATLAAFLLFAVAMAWWWLRVFPANAEFAGWVGGAVPDDWEAWRSRWEYGHAVRAVLHLAGFASLAWSVLADTPAPLPRRAPAG